MVEIALFLVKKELFSHMFLRIIANSEEQSEQ